MSYKIEITENSISIKTQEQLFNDRGDAVRLGPSHRRSIGVGDFAVDPSNPTDEERNSFREAMDSFCSKYLGRNLSDVMVDISIRVTERNNAEVELTRQRQRVRALMDRAAKLANEKAALEEQLANGARTTPRRQN